MPSKEFLEKYPLYRKFKIESKFDETNKIPKPAIKMYCNHCKTEQTFNMVNEFYELEKYVNISPKGKIYRARYICMSCKSFNRYFFIEFSRDLTWIKKVGQFPPWNLSIDKDLRLLLDNNINIYQKGLICESQGYGIGAFAYYRRIVEDIIDDLLNDLYILIDENNKKEYKSALDQLKDSHVAEDKIKAVQDLLPKSLAPEGNNPLKLLYSTLSEGIHSDSDETCLNNAEMVRHILTYLINEVNRHQRDSNNFTDSIQKLLKKKQIK